ncbi:MAG: 6-phosphogluconolactonase [Rhodospirillaceae bacterium]|nr:6-phosphogluconolactonase [Rhodospirillaceae bacterium]
MRIEVANDPQAVAILVADWLVTAVETAVHARGRFVLGLAGGSTPRLLYQTLARPAYATRLPWHAMHLLWGDERFVPQDHADSNYRMVADALIKHVPVPRANVHPIPTDGTPVDAASRYESILRNLYGSSILDPARPLFDVILLGLGTDGHTASLFPGTAAMSERIAWATAVEGVTAQPRLTLTFPAIACSRTVAFIVTGADKRQIFRYVRANGSGLPATHVTSAGQIVWYADSAAAQ